MISLHLIADNADPKRLDRAVAYLKNTKQKYVNIAGGSQIDRAMQLAERVQIEIPGIQVFWRVLEDTGNVVTMPDATWWVQRIQPRLQWMKDHKVIMVIDNETSGSDSTIVSYVNHSLVRMKMLHDNGLYGAFCRFATGNINDGSQPGTSNQYLLLKPLLDQLSAGDWISPNEYSNKPGKSSGGHLERYKHIEAVTTNKLNVSIGECGVLNEYRARDGYRTVPMSGKDMAAQLIGEEMWYRGGSIPRFLYCIGGYSEWETLQVGDDALEFLEGYYAKNPIEQSTPQPPIINPPYKPDPITVNMQYKLTLPADYVNLRTAPGTNSSIIGQAFNGSVVTALEESLVSGEYWRKVANSGSTGWLSMQGGAVKFQLVSVEPPPVEPPKPPVKEVTIPLSVLSSLRQNLQGSIDIHARFIVQSTALMKDLQDELEVIDALIRGALET